jgi:anti-anti-sigma factor
VSANDLLLVPPGSSAAGEVSVLFEPRRTVVLLSGEVDHAMEPELRQAAEAAINAGNRVQVDARHVRFIDSIGLALIARLAASLPGRVSLLHPPPHLQLLLDVGQLHRVVRIVPTDV